MKKILILGTIDRSDASKNDNFPTIIVNSEIKKAAIIAARPKQPEGPFPKGPLQSGCLFLINYYHYVTQSIQFNSILFATILGGRNNKLCDQKGQTQKRSGRQRNHQKKFCRGSKRPFQTYMAGKNTITKIKQQTQ